MRERLVRWRDQLRRFAPWLAMAGIFVAAALLFAHRTRSPLERLILAGTHRPTLGRLSGETMYRPRRTRVTIASAPARDATHSPDLLDRAILDLLRGDLERAIAGFELASRSQPAAQEALTNLSAAYLERFDAKNDCLDLLRAVHAADRGLALQRNHPALLFNRATALRQPGADAEWERALPLIESRDVSQARVEEIPSQFARCCAVRRSSGRPSSSRRRTSSQVSAYGLHPARV